MATTRELVPFFVPETTDLNATLAPSSPPRASTPPPDAAPPRVWDRSEGFFVPAAAAAAPEPAPRTPARRSPRARAHTPAYAGGSFEVASPPPEALPMPRFAVRPRVLVDDVAMSAAPGAEDAAAVASGELRKLLGLAA